MTSPSSPDGRFATLPTSPLPPPLDELFAPLLEAERWTVGQLGQSLDGRIATDSGHSHYVTGPEDLDRLHGLRALADAVIVGAGTVAADNPRLTVRRGPWTGQPALHPVRVVLDPRGRLDPNHHLFCTGEAPTLWVTAAGAKTGPEERREVHEGREGGGGREEAMPMSPHVEPWELPGPEIDPHHLLEALAARGLTRVLVEGGGLTVSRFLAAGALDRLQVVVAPLLIGSGRPGITLPAIATLDEALRPPSRIFRLGSDVLFDLDLS